MKKSIEQTYQKKTQLEHVLDRPGMYIGDIEFIKSERYIINDSVITKKIIEYSPGLYKIFDEIITNAIDHSQRDSSMKRIDILIDKDSVSITNDGKGIPVILHKEYNKYVPEIIFGEFHTSSNYDDTEKRTVGGLNGYGAKLTNVFSTTFTVEISDSTNHYIQSWTNNMRNTTGPVITKKKGTSFTRITFTPDYPRFQMGGMDSYYSDLIKTRVYDAAAVTAKGVNVYFNNDRVPIKNFEEYIRLFGIKEYYYERYSDRWEFAFALANEKFGQVSFVNGISTSEGGTHVDYIVNQVVAKIKDNLEKKHKDITIKPSYIKDNITVFINCLIENPTFSSQTKESHVTKIAKFGSKCELSEETIKKIDKLGISLNVLDIAKAKESKSLSKTDGKRQLRIIVPKLDDANRAGGSEGWKCKLILTEGDSAKASAIAGLSVVGRDYYGVFPLRGKLLNVRDATPAQLLKNEEINNLKKILGLQQGKEYKSTKDLRYGGILIFTDADADGSHIKGLIINFIHSFWPSLMLIPDFVSSIITPIVKASKGKVVKPFYNITDFNKWKDSENVKSWQVKYYKGLGTSTASESKEYFSNLSKRTLNYSYSKEDSDQIVKAFKKGYEDSRKEWITDSIGKEQFINYNSTQASITDFINMDLVHFSIADLERSIPNMMDGFKPSQRKVLYACLKRNLYSEIKVAQLSGYISEHTSYHHGEVSLQGTIVNMAQDYVGSNNINLLDPIGQFGTRLQGGKDSGSPRYIFTRLRKIVKEVFNAEDNELLDYLNDDGLSIEPKYYIPVLPMVLVNGSEGIGTGYSTNIPCYNPKDIINNLKLLIKDPDSNLVPMTPWYSSFKGTIVRESTNKYVTTGKYSRINTTTIEVTELPIGRWTQTYKEFLDSLLEENEIVDYTNNSDDLSISFKIVLQKTVLDDLINKNELIKKFKLTSIINTSNMHVFDENCKIIKVSCPEEIIVRFYSVRKAHFIKRKANILKKLNKEYSVLNSKVVFIKLVISEKVVVFNKKKDSIITELEKFEELIKIDNCYDYLLDLKIWTFTKERITELESQLEKTKKEIESTNTKSIESVWQSELDIINGLIN